MTRRTLTVSGVDALLRFANALSQRLNPNVGLPLDERVVLPDLLMDSTRDLYRQIGLPVRLGDWMVISSVVMTVARLVSLSGRRVEAVRRLGWVLGFSYIMRGVLQCSTLLPAPWLECPEYVQRSLLEDSLRLFLGLQTSCGDVLPSGHAIIFTALALLSVQYCDTSSVASVLMTAMVVVHTLLANLVLVASTYHYLVDVQIAALLTAAIWLILHNGFRHGSRPYATTLERCCARLDGQMIDRDDYLLLSTS